MSVQDVIADFDASGLFHLYFHSSISPSHRHSSAPGGRSPLLDDSTTTVVSGFVAKYGEQLNCLRTLPLHAEEPLSPSQQQFHDRLSQLSKEELLRHAAALHDAIHRHFPLLAGGSVATDPLLLSYQSEHSGPVAEHFRRQEQLCKAVDEVGSKIINEYVVLKDLGRGSCGKVKLAYHTAEGRLVALKIVPRERPLKLAAEERVPASRREVSLLKRLDHPRIVRLYEVIEDPSSAKVYLAMQYVDGGHRRPSPGAPAEEQQRQQHPSRPTDPSRPTRIAGPWVTRVD